MAVSPPITAEMELIDDEDDDESGSGKSGSQRGDDSMVSEDRRHRRLTECSEDSGIVNCKEVASFQEVLQNKARPSNIAGNDADADLPDDSVLGMIHLDLAKYHEIGRFCEDGEKDNYDKDAALFHLKCAASCGIIVAKVSLAKMFYGMPHDILAELEAPDNMPEEERHKQAFGYMMAAAEAGDRSSMVFMAKAFDSGLNLDSAYTKCKKAALEWYEKISALDYEMADASNDWGMDDPPYLVLARQAELWLEGDEGLEKDPSRSGELYNEAAEAAMACMKGKMANKYYMLAEEAYGQCEEEDEE